MNDAIFDLIKQERLRRGWTQSTLAKRSGTSLYTVCFVERGVGNPTLETLTRLLSALGYELYLEAKNCEKGAMTHDAAHTN